MGAAESVIEHVQRKSLAQHMQGTIDHVQSKSIAGHIEGTVKAVEKTFTPVHDHEVVRSLYLSKKTTSCPDSEDSKLTTQDKAQMLGLAGGKLCVSLALGGADGGSVWVTTFNDLKGAYDTWKSGMKLLDAAKKVRDPASLKSVIGSIAGLADSEWLTEQFESITSIESSCAMAVEGDDESWMEKLKDKYDEEEETLLGVRMDLQKAGMFPKVGKRYYLKSNKFNRYVTIEYEVGLQGKLCLWLLKNGISICLLVGQC
jgi:hypothetical protein